MFAGLVLRWLRTAWQRWPSRKTRLKWMQGYCLGFVVLGSAYNLFNLGRWWTDDMMAIQLAHAVIKGDGVMRLGDRHQVYCFLTAGSDPGELAAYLTPDMQSDLMFWVGLTARPASGEWWLAVQSGHGAGHVHRMSGKFRPDLKGALCANGQRLALYGAEAFPSDLEPNGLIFQVRVLPP